MNKIQIEWLGLWECLLDLIGVGLEWLDDQTRFPQ